MKRFIVWNAARTEGFITDDPQLAYEVRKSSESNCYNELAGELSSVAMAFCNRWCEDDCTIQEIEVD